jgi:hypothetical protein
MANNSYGYNSYGSIEESALLVMASVSSLSRVYYVKINIRSTHPT